MSYFKARLDDMRGSGDELSRAVSLLDASSRDIETLRAGLKNKYKGKQRIDQRIRESTSKISHSRYALENARNALNDIINQYQSTENKLSGANPVTSSTSGSQGDGFGQGMEFPVIGLLIPTLFPILGPARPWGNNRWFPFYIDWRKLIAALDDDTGIKPYVLYDPAHYPGNRGTNAGSSSDENDGAETKSGYKSDNLIKDFDKNGKRDLGGKYGYYDPKDHKFHEQTKDEYKENSKKPDLDLTIYGKEVSKEVNWYDKSGLAGDADGTHAKGEVKVGNAGADAGAYASVLGIGAYAGASACALDISGEAQLGNDNLGIYAKGDATVGKADAKAEASAGLLNKDGDFDPNLYVGAKAEALVGEVSGTVGGKVLGTDVGVTGSLNYGIGAHAEVGVQDGKVTVDVGASFGVGASVKIEVDASGTIDAMAGFVKSIFA